jgi:hypothetical protein
VKLFLVTDIDDERVLADHKKLILQNKNMFHQKKYLEAYKIVWMDTDEYLSQTLLTGLEAEQSYSWQFV